MSCVAAIEASAAECAELVGRMAHTVAYAKHKIALKDRDLVTAESSLQLLLKLPLTPFDSALNAVKRYAEATQESGGGGPQTDFFQLLAAKYPR